MKRKNVRVGLIAALSLSIVVIGILVVQNVGLQSTSTVSTSTCDTYEATRIYYQTNIFGWIYPGSIEPGYLFKDRTVALTIPVQVSVGDRVIVGYYASPNVWTVYVTIMNGANAVESFFLNPDHTEATLTLTRSTTITHVLINGTASDQGALVTLNTIEILKVTCIYEA